jgi:hypothetical protein
MQKAHDNLIFGVECCGSVAKCWFLVASGASCEEAGCASMVAPIAQYRRFNASPGLGDRAASVEGATCGRMNGGGDSSGEEDALAFGGGPPRVPGLVYRNRFCPIANRFSLIPETVTHRRRPGWNRSRCRDGGSQEGIFRSTGEMGGSQEVRPIGFYGLDGEVPMVSRAFAASFRACSSVVVAVLAARSEAPLSACSACCRAAAAPASACVRAC